MMQLLLDRLSTWALWFLFAWGFGYVLLRIAGLDERKPSPRQQARIDRAADRAFVAHTARALGIVADPGSVAELDAWYAAPAATEQQRCRSPVRTAGPNRVLGRRRRMSEPYYADEQVFDERVPCTPADHCFREDNCTAHASHTGAVCCCCGATPEDHKGCDCP